MLTLLFFYSCFPYSSPYLEPWLCPPLYTGLGADYRLGPRVYCLDMGLQGRAGCRAQPVGQDPVRPSFSVILLFSGHPGFLWGVTLALTVTRTAFASPADHLALSSSGSAGYEGMPTSLMTRESQKRTPHRASALP